MTATLAPEVENLLERAASLPRGLAFLHRGPLEIVAITLGVDARLVARVRRQIDDPAEHRQVIEAYRTAVERWRRGPQPDCFPHPAPPEAPHPVDAEQLLRAAAEHPLGTAFLLEGQMEAVAVTFGVHPFVVDEARGLLERRRRGPGSE